MAAAGERVSGRWSRRRSWRRRRSTRRLGRSGRRQRGPERGPERGQRGPERGPGRSSRRPGRSAPQKRPPKDRQPEGRLQGEAQATAADDARRARAGRRSAEGQQTPGGRLRSIALEVLAVARRVAKAAGHGTLPETARPLEGHEGGGTRALPVLPLPRRNARRQRVSPLRLPQLLVQLINTNFTMFYAFSETTRVIATTWWAEQTAAWRIASPVWRRGRTSPVTTP